LQLAFDKPVKTVEIRVDEEAYIACLAALGSAIGRLAVTRHRGQCLFEWHPAMFLRNPAPLVTVAQQILMGVELIHDLTKSRLDCCRCRWRILLRCHLSRGQTQIQRDTEATRAGLRRSDASVQVNQLGPKVLESPA